MVILLFFAFVSGLVTIFAPCIWPLLPIILSSTTSGGHRKPLGITLGIIISFAIFTLTLSYILKIIPIDPNAIRFLAVVVIGFLGLSLVIPKLSEILEGYVSRLSGKFGQSITGTSDPASITKQGFWSGVVTGFALGIVWTPCAGPILATIATLASTTAVNFQIVLVTIAYVVGVGIPLFAFATFGRALFTKSRFLSQYTARIQQVFGVVMILTAVAIYTNYDKVLQAKLLDAFPAYVDFINTLEGNESVKNQLDIIKGKKDNKPMLNKAFDLSNYGRAPEFTGIYKWLNVDTPLTMEGLRGKVVLIDFWTYTCINCIRTLPHVTSWYEKYKDQELVVVGVHTPEFEFEKKTENVQQAIKQHNITYPVAQDNDYETWNAYANRYWPAKYLIDAKGTIRYTHFGEGKYEETEEAIQALLKEAGAQVVLEKTQMPDQTPRTQLTPEIYLGSKRMSYLFPDRGVDSGTYDFTLAQDLPQDRFSFGGKWTIGDEYAMTVADSVLTLHFYGSKVFLVMRPPKAGAGAVRVFLDGNFLLGETVQLTVEPLQGGADVESGVVTVDSDRLYNLIDLREGPGSHILRLEFQTPGIETYAFTFG